MNFEFLRAIAVLRAFHWNLLSVIRVSNGVRFVSFRKFGICLNQKLKQVGNHDVFLSLF